MNDGERVDATAVVNGLRMHYVRQGAGPLVLLLHGWPQTSYVWRFVAPALAERHTVVAPDLRGYGLTDAPAAGYDKRTMAADVRELAHSLGHERMTLVGHDRGARIAHRYALDHPDEVERLVVLDIIPTREVLRRLDARLMSAYWHWFFHFQPDLPELLVGANVRAYLEYFFAHWAHRRGALDEAAVEHYVRAFSRPGALRAGFEDYRATLSHDLPADEASAAAGERLTMPVLALWGGHGLIGRLPAAEIWAEYAENVQAEEIPDCGHFLPEEQPAAVADRILEFLAQTGTPARA